MGWECLLAGAGEEDEQVCGCVLCGVCVRGRERGRAEIERLLSCLMLRGQMMGIGGAREE